MYRSPSRYCSYDCCKNTTSTNGVHIFRFPKDAQRCLLWVNACKNPKLDGVPASKLYANNVLCGAHFQAWCFMNPVKKNKLVYNAIPDSPKLVTGVRNEQNFVKPISAKQCMTEDLTLPSTTAKLNESSTDECAHDFQNKRPRLLCETQSATPDVSKPAFSTSGRTYSPRKVKMSKQLKRLKDTNRSLKARHWLWQEKFKRMKATPMQNRLLTDSGHNGKSNFLKRQVQLISQKVSAPRYSQTDKICAYRVYSKSRAAYRYLRNLLELPSESTLKRFISSKLCSPGMNSDVLKALKGVLDTKKKQDKVFALVFDEMSLKPCLTYDAKLDLVQGFEDFGSGERSKMVANQALVLMIRSLTSKKKLPIAFFFSKHAMPAAKLKKIILDALQSLTDAGVCIKALICDQGTNNTKVFSSLGITPHSPYFTFREEKVYGLFDPPHLLKNLRRNLMKYDLQTDKGCISFKHIAAFYEFDKHRTPRCAPKLTDRHIYVTGMDSMKVSLASQVFSNTVSASMSLCIMIPNVLDSSAAPTVRFVKEVNDLFDSVNGTNLKPLHGKQLHCSASHKSGHLIFWKDMLQAISSWSFLANKPNVKMQASPRCKPGWTLTLTSLCLLTEEMLQTLDYFMTGRCNQDCIENFFSQVRSSGGNRTNPTPYEFASAYRLASVNMCATVNKYSNCEPDKDKFLFQLLQLKTDNCDGDCDEATTSNSGASSSNNGKSVNCDLDDSVLDSSCLNELDFTDKNTCTYLAGYVARRVLHKHDCVVCVALLTDGDKQMLNHTLYTHFKEYEPRSEHGLKYPTEKMSECFAKLFYVSQIYFEKSLSYANVLSNLQNLFHDVKAMNFIDKCDVHCNDVKKKISCYSAKLFLKIHLREINRKMPNNVIDLKKLKSKK